MRSCPKCQNEMKETLTKAGVLIDKCLACKGVWLDQGEINYFVKNRRVLIEYETGGLNNPKQTEMKCPACHEKLTVGVMPKFNFEVEECGSCKGLYFEYLELNKILAEGKIKKIQTDSKIHSKANEKNKLKKKKVFKPLFKMPSLAMTSLISLSAMYGLLFGVIVFAVEVGYVKQNIGLLFFMAIVLLQFIFSPWIMDWSLRLFGSLNWTDIDSLPGNTGLSLKKLCKENKIPLPKLGIISDGSPQAYTYGRTPRSARLVLSEGIFDILNEDEVEAVIAHELGHIKHWDFVLMTIAQLVPTLLYQIYRNLEKMGKRSSKNNASAIATATTVAYIAYYISNYIVMFISRVREYYADKFSCYATKNPNALLNALVKIGFGLASADEGMQKIYSKDHEQKRKAIQSMGIMNISTSKAMAVSFQDMDLSKPDKVKSIKEVMRWDLWSPWAKYYELSSTHPLTAKRINAIGAHAISMGQKPDVIFDLRKPESYWDDFLKDLVVMFLPFIFPIIFLGKHIVSYLLGKTEFMTLDIVLPITFGIGIGGVIKTLMMYPNERFMRHSVSSLLRKVKVSPVKAHPVKLEGTLIGRGESGNRFSEDFVIRDKTGILFLDHEPLGFNAYFAFKKMKNYLGEEAIVEGWYRRAPVPYLEVKKIITSVGDSSSSYIREFILFIYILVPCLALIFMKLR